MSWVATGVAVGGSILGSMQANDSAREDAKMAGRKAGKNRAQLDMARKRAEQMLPQKAKQVEEAALLAKVDTTKKETAAVAEATVAAAASGSKGTSVTQTAQSIETNAATVQAQLEKQRRAGLLQVNQEYEDIWWEAENQKFGVDVKGGGSAGMQLATAALSGLGAYAGAGGFDKE